MLVGTGAVLAAAGIAAWIIGGVLTTNLRTECERDGRCPDNVGERTAQIRTMDLLANAGIWTGVALGGAGVAFWMLLEQDEHRASPAVSVVPDVANGGFVVRGVF